MLKEGTNEMHKNGGGLGLPLQAEYDEQETGELLEVGMQETVGNGGEEQVTTAIIDYEEQGLTEVFAIQEELRGGEMRIPKGNEGENQSLSEEIGGVEEEDSNGVEGEEQATSVNPAVAKQEAPGEDEDGKESTPVEVGGVEKETPKLGEHEKQGTPMDVDVEEGTSKGGEGGKQSTPVDFESLDREILKGVADEKKATAETNDLGLETTEEIEGKEQKTESQTSLRFLDYSFKKILELISMTKNALASLLPRTHVVPFGAVYEKYFSEGAMFHDKELFVAALIDGIYPESDTENEKDDPSVFNSELSPEEKRFIEILALSLHNCIRSHILIMRRSCYLSPKYMDDTLALWNAMENYALTKEEEKFLRDIFCLLLIPTGVEAIFVHQLRIPYEKMSSYEFRLVDEVRVAICKCKRRYPVNPEDSLK